MTKNLDPKPYLHLYTFERYTTGDRTVPSLYLAFWPRAGFSKRESDYS